MQRLPRVGRRGWHVYGFLVDTCRSHVHLREKILWIQYPPQPVHTTADGGRVDHRMLASAVAVRAPTSSWVITRAEWSEVRGTLYARTHVYQGEAVCTVLWWIMYPPDFFPFTWRHVCDDVAACAWWCGSTCQMTWQAIFTKSINFKNNAIIQQTRRPEGTTWLLEPTRRSDLH
jgi:hypothetical protein